MITIHSVDFHQLTQEDKARFHNGSPEINLPYGGWTKVKVDDRAFSWRLFQS